MVLVELEPVVTSDIVVTGSPQIWFLEKNRRPVFALGLRFRRAAAPYPP